MSSKGYAPVGRNRKSSIGENMQFAFVHLRILDVAKSALLKQQKISLHEMAYAVLTDEQLGLDTPPEELANHKIEAGDSVAAFQLLLAAKLNSAAKTSYIAASIFAYRSSQQLEKLRETEPLSDELDVQYTNLVVYCAGMLAVAGAAALTEEQKQIFEETSSKKTELLSAVTPETFLSTTPELALIKLESVSFGFIPFMMSIPTTATNPLC